MGLVPVSITAAVLQGRAAAQALQTDMCTVTRAGAGEPVYNPATDTYTYPTGSTVYTGKCRVKPADTIDQDVAEGETVVGSRRYIVSLPAVTDGVQRNDIVAVTASVLDPLLVGSQFRVLGALKGSQLTARRLACEEVTA